MLMCVKMASLRFFRSFSSLLPRSCANSRITMTEFVMPSHTNPAGFANAGQLLAWMDLCGATSTLKHTNAICVTASVDSVIFKEPITMGSLVTLEAVVTRSFSSSMEVKIRVLAEKPSLNIPRRECVTAFMTFVRLGRDGVPQPVDPIVPETREEEEQYELAQLRRKKRLEHKVSMEEIKKEIESMQRPKDEQIQNSNQLAQAKKCASSFVESSRVVFPNQTNIKGTTFGGQIMSWMESSAYISALRHTNHVCATVCVDALSFRAPSFVGEVVTTKSQVNRTFKTSMEVGVIVEAEDLLAREKRNVAKAHFVLVCADENMRTLPVPPVIPETDQEKRRFNEAELRRKLRNYG